ncbi:DHH family phosphoesterase [Bacillus solitudinis]|uniref:DHH family phosphoesterase n=1 Tax=Bacillus solitudinis TaxID=2014074 RepID=UPI000C2308B5|nr:oligoribonuclease [Bacillus solitudinis]
MHRLFTHNDLDGVGCGILARIAFGQDTDILYNSVQSLDTQVARLLERHPIDDIIWITDLSVNDENASRLEAFSTREGSVNLIDHHKTALHLNDYSWGHVRVEEEDGRLASATSLFYDHLVKKKLIQISSSIEEFVELVRQWDTWEWETNQNFEAKRLNDLFFLLAIDEFEARMVKRLQENDHFSFDEFEQQVLDMEETKIERYIRRKRRELVQTFINEQCVGIVHAESYHSELGNELGKENPHLDYIAILNVGGKKMSFRTIHDHIDVSDVAKRYDGGGHAKASGAVLTEDAYNRFIAEVFPLTPLRIDAHRNHFNTKNSRNGTLYHSVNQGIFFIYQLGQEQWVLEKNEKILQSFSSFEDAEYHIKRHHQAALTRDDKYVEYLSKVTIREKQQHAKNELKTSP